MYHKSMKKIITIALFFLIFFFSRPILVFGQDFIRDAPKALYNAAGWEMPGLQCGVGGSTDGTEKCCDLSSLNPPAQLGIKQVLSNDVIKGIVDILGNIPIIGGIFRIIGTTTIDNTVDRFQKLDDFQKKYGNVQCIYGEPKISGGNCVCEATQAANLNRSVGELCYNYLTKSKELPQCLSCAASNGMWTGIGCIPLNLQSFVSTFLLSTGVGLGGIIALICIIYSAFMMQTSQGNPEKIKKAQENLTSCILGLMLIIFSVFILRLIGVDILKIPFLQ